MTKRGFSTFSILLLAFFVSAGCTFSNTVNATETWNQTYGGTNYDIPSSLIQTSDGGYAIAGVTRSFADECELYLVKVDGSGNIQWNQTYAESNMNGITSLVQTNDGGYAIASATTSFGTNEYDLYLVKADDTGNIQWNQTYAETNSNGVTSLVQTSDGGYAIASESSVNDDECALYLVKVDNTGNIQWNQTYRGTNYDGATSLVQTNDGGYAIASDASFGASYTDFWLVKVDDTGNIQWNQTYGGDNLESSNSLVQTSDGGYAIAGITRSFGSGATDYWLVKADDTGNIQWNQTYGGTNDDWAISLVQTSDGGYAIVGFTESFGAGEGDFWLIKVDDTGIIPEFSPFSVMVTVIMISLIFLILGRKIRNEKTQKY